MPTFSLSHFYQAIVLEVINDPQEFINLREEGEDSKFYDLFKNTDKVKGILRLAGDELKKEIQIAPLGSIVAVPIKAGEVNDHIPKVFYPFFSTHLSLPIKPGEKVWIMYPDNQAGVSQVATNVSEEKNPKELVIDDGELKTSGYWMSRVASPSYVEDLNFTHSERERDKTYLKDSLSNDNSKDVKRQSYNNGIFIDSVPPKNKTIKQGPDYREIHESSLSLSSTTREAVPRFKSRPGDLTLQGSNNTLIMLGEDRPSGLNYELKEGQESKPGPRKDLFAGSIDLVAGRGNVGPDPEKHLPESPYIDELENIKNSWWSGNDWKEIEKRPWVKDKDKKSTQKITEGDPNFTWDKSRLYISMKTDGDKNLGYEDPKLLPKFGNESIFNPVDQSPFIISKSKEIRIISSQMKDKDNKFDKSSAGSIRIIKEGELDPDGHSIDQGSIIISSDGNMLIDSPSIVIGSGKELGNGEGTQIYFGNNAKEPIVLGNKLKDDILVGILDVLGQLSDMMLSHFHATGVGPSGPADPGTIGNINSSTKTKISEVNNKLTSILSKIAKTK